MASDYQTDAVISECGKYRYLLQRTWDSYKPVCAFVMLNPSTADALQDDPTIRRCIGFAKSFGCGGLVVGNLFALRATDPRKLAKADDPVGPDNDGWLCSIAGGSSLVIAGWGAHPLAIERSKKVSSLLMDRFRCLGTTKAGHPRHPLYVPANTEHTRWLPKTGAEGDE